MNATHQIAEYVYSDQSLLGAGVFGRVYKGYHIHDKTTPYAIKQISLQVIPERMEGLIKSINREVKVLSKISHDNIVKFKDFLLTNNNIYVVTEFCNRKNLEELMIRKGSLKVRNALVIVSHIADAMAYLNKQDIIHRDLKPANILIHDHIAKVADFGLARMVNDSTISLTEGVGTPLYMAPEVYEGTYLENKFKCDVWSLGMILYEMIFGNLPWRGKSEYMHFEEIRTKSLKFPKGHNVHKLVLDLIAKMLEKDPEERIDFENILNHKAFSLFD